MCNLVEGKCTLTTNQSAQWPTFFFLSGSNFTINKLTSCPVSSIVGASNFELRDGPLATSARFCSAGVRATRSVVAEVVVAATVAPEPKVPRARLADTATKDTSAARLSAILAVCECLCGIYTCMSIVYVYVTCGYATTMYTSLSYINTSRLFACVDNVQ